MHSIELSYALAAPGGRPGLRNALMDLLQAVRQEGSITGAAKVLDQSYRHVWGELKRWESRLERELIVWEKGQPARLTAFGEKLLWAERQAQARLAPQLAALHADLERAFAVAFDDAAQVLPMYASHDEGIAALRGHAAQARLVSMVGPGHPASTQDWNERVSRADHALIELGPADVTVLGMGLDGHFASLFAGSPQLAQALDLQCVHACMAVTLPAPPAEVPFDRITQTLAHLARSGLWVLPLIGHEKMEVLRRSLSQTPMQSPVSALLQPNRTPLELWITP